MPSDLARREFMRRDDAHAAVARGPARRSVGEGGDENQFGAAANDADLKGGRGTTSTGSRGRPGRRFGG